MAGTWVANAAGVYQPVKSLFSADATGTYRPIKNLAVTDSTGTYRQGFNGAPLDPDFGLATSRSPLQPWTAVVLTWPALGPAGTLYRVYLSGSPTQLNADTSVLRHEAVGLQPFTTYAFELEYELLDGTIRRGAKVTGRTIGLAPPANLRAAALDSEFVTLRFGELTGVSSYQLFNHRTQKVLERFSGEPYFRPVVSGLAYDLSVRAMVGNTPGSLSNRLTFTAPRASANVSPGIREYPAISAATWQAGLGTWRPSSEGLYHGDGRQWGSDRGVQSSWFFYGADRFLPLRGGRVVKFEVLIRRTPGSGASTAETSRWIIHSHTGRPVGSPLEAGQPITDLSNLLPGVLVWTSLPVGWGQALVNGIRNGLGWGAVDLRYMRAASLLDDLNMGRLRITIG